MVITPLRLHFKNINEMNLKELHQKERDFQQYLKENWYTFIGPSNKSDLPDYIEKIKNIRINKNYGSNIHNALSDKEIVEQLIDLHPDKNFDLYVVYSVELKLPIFATVQEYCDEIGISYPW